MTIDDWKALIAARAVADRAASSGRLDQVRSALIELHRLMTIAPSEVQVAYKDVDESLLVSEAELRIDGIADGDLSWSFGQTDDVLGWTTSAAIQIRALDRYLLRDARDHDGPPADPNSDWRSPDGSHFLIPRKRPREPDPKRRARKSYKRRGVLHHRILPCELMGYSVILHWQDALASANGESGARHGAALFKGLELDTEDRDGGFIVTGVRCEDTEGTLALQMEAALADGCVSVVWPELTISPELLEKICAFLRDRALDGDGRTPPQILVAGSWHEVDEDKVRNVATVLDGYGGVKLRFEKMMPFDSTQTGPEKIAPGGVLPVIITDDRLIAFAICRDFCEEDLDLPYPNLDVDLVLVPSMGGAKTMRSHQGTAKAIRVRYGCRTFIVQQGDAPDPDGALGYVMPAPDDPEERTPAEMRQFEIWRSYGD